MHTVLSNYTWAFLYSSNIPTQHQACLALKRFFIRTPKPLLSIYISINYTSTFLYSSNIPAQHQACLALKRFFIRITKPLVSIYVLSNYTSIYLYSSKLDLQSSVFTGNISLHSAARPRSPVSVLMTRNDLLLEGCFSSRKRACIHIWSRMYMYKAADSECSID